MERYHRPKSKINNVKVHDENVEEYPHELGLGKIPWENEESTNNKRKINHKINFINIKYYSLKESINKLSMQATDWKKILIVHVTDSKL